MDMRRRGYFPTMDLLLLTWDEPKGTAARSPWWWLRKLRKVGRKAWRERGKARPAPRFRWHRG